MWGSSEKTKTYSKRKKKKEGVNKEDELEYNLMLESSDEEQVSVAANTDEKEVQLEDAIQEQSKVYFTSCSLALFVS